MKSLEIGQVLTFGLNTKRTVISYTPVDYPNKDIVARVKLQGAKGKVYDGFFFKYGRVRVI